MKKIKKFLSAVCEVLLLALVITTLGVGLADFFIPDLISVSEGEKPNLGVFCDIEEEEVLDVGRFSTESRAKVKLFGILPLKDIRLTTYDRLRLIPGGEVFGLKVAFSGVMVTGISEITTSDGGKCCPAASAGLRCGDIILSIDSTPCKAVATFTERIAASNGRPLTLSVKRGEEALTLTLSPVFSQSEGGYRAGIWVKDSAAGIGTVTFIDPETGAFGGLGHGIYEAESGTLLPVSRGTVTAVDLTGVQSGKAGAPGELRGHLEEEKLGSLLSNTDCGVFGVLAGKEKVEKEPIPIGLSSTVKVGPATILCTLEDGKTESYAIEITELRRGDSLTKSFCIKVTDPRLLAVTGGIVQGMSGSPIIQNGKLIGAVTHVLINNPQSGYGIFIENMLRSMPNAIRPLAA